jgi:hypothetical protein
MQNLCTNSSLINLEWSRSSQKQQKQVGAIVGGCEIMIKSSVTH